MGSGSGQAKLVLAPMPRIDLGLGSSSDDVTRPLRNHSGELSSGNTSPERNLGIN